MPSCRFSFLVNPVSLTTTKSTLSGIAEGLRLSRDHSYTGTSGTNILAEGGTLKKVVSLNP